MGKYGHFSDDGLEYVITTPDTPRDWFNFFWNPTYLACAGLAMNGCSLYQNEAGVVTNLLGKQDMQGLGSAMTYARRYGLMAMAGIAPEDDDGNAAVKSAPNKAQQGLQDAWRDRVLDTLPDNATPAQKADAFALAICDEFKGKGERALQNSWERRKKYIAEFEAKYPSLYGDVVHAYEAQMHANEHAKNEGEAA